MFTMLKSRFSHKKETLTSERDNLSAQLSLADERENTLRLALNKLQIKNNELEKKYIRQNDGLTLYQTRMDEMKESINDLRTTISSNAVITRYVDFARSVASHRKSLAADVYICHGVETLPAAGILKKEVGGASICDVIEYPTFTKRGIPDYWTNLDASFLDAAFEGYLRDCDRLLTIGPSLGNDLKKYNVPVTVIPNYRPSQDLKKTNKLREEFKFKDSDKVIVAISTLKSGIEELLYALARLPSHFFLVIIGQLVPEQYELRIRKLINSLDLFKRVKFKEPVAYNELTDVISSADLGLIVRDPELINNKFSLPNRIFDYVMSGIPVCSPNINDIASYIREYQLGAVLKSTSKEGWFDGINEVMDNISSIQDNVHQAAAQLTWESLEDSIYESLCKPKSALLLNYYDAKKNNRTMRLAKTLTDRGCKVSICCAEKNESLQSLHSQSEIEFVYLT